MWRSLLDCLGLPFTLGRSTDFDSFSLSLGMALSPFVFRVQSFLRKVDFLKFGDRGASLQEAVKSF